MSHCVKYSLEDIVEAFDDPTKLFLLEDGCSPVPTPFFEKVGRDFVTEMKARWVED